MKDPVCLSRSVTRIALAALAALATAALVFATRPVAAAPGDLITTVNLPVTGFGVSVGVDCEGSIYYTVSSSTSLYKMTKAGALLAVIPITNSVGAGIFMDEFTWDNTRQLFWMQEHNTSPIKIYKVNPATGLAAFQFAASSSVGTFRDGIAYDASDDTLWISGDVSTTIDHVHCGNNGPPGSPATPAVITPKNSFGSDLGSISGVTVGVGDLLYLGRDGFQQIVRVKKSDGSFVGLFASPGGQRDEGLECDPVNFAPKLALWSREFNSPGFLAAIELEAGTCACGGQQVVCPPSIVTNVGAGSSAIVNYPVPAGSNIVCNPASGSVFPVGTTTVTCCDVEPSKTNCCNFNITVIGSSNRPPVSSCQGTIIVSADPATCSACTNIDNGSSDPDTGDTITLVQVPPCPYPLGTNIVTLIVTDSHGASNSCTATVIVVDTTPPDITCPSNIVVATDPGQCSAVVNYTVTASDACSGAPINVAIYEEHSDVGGGTPYDELVGSFGASSVTFATDTGYNWHPFGLGDFGADITGCLNVAADGSYNFGLNSDDGSLLYIDGNLVVDNGGPHSPNVANGSASLTAGIHSFEVQFFECCGGESGVDLGLPAGVSYASCGLAVTCDPPSGSSFPKGANTVTCCAVDASGNTNCCSFTVTVEDHEAPVAGCREAVNPSGKKIPTAGKNPKSGQNPDGFYQLLGKDNCDANPTIYIQDSVTGYLFGPFANGDIVKITQSNHDTTRPMPPPIVAHIQLVGDALVYAVDADGNVGASVSCLVPKPPK